MYLTPVSADRGYSVCPLCIGPSLPCPPSLQPLKTCGSPSTSYDQPRSWKETIAVETWTSIEMEKRGKVENQEACLNSHDLSCLGKVLYHSENNTAACVQRPQWRNSMAWEHSGVYWCVEHVGTVVLGWERGSCGLWEGKGMQVQGKWQMPPFVWTYPGPL